MEYLLNKGAIIDDSSTTYGSPLHYACRSGRIQICKLLIDFGANVNLKVGHNQMTPLHLLIISNAPRSGANKIVKKLIEKGADVNAKYLADGSTCLHLAVRRNREELVRILAKNGALLNVQNFRGETPYEVALKLPKLPRFRITKLFYSIGH